MRPFLGQLLQPRQGLIIAKEKRDGRIIPAQFQTASSLIMWATREMVHGDIFFCPMRRRDGNQWSGIGGRFLWADVDWQKVPHADRDLVARKVAMLGHTLVSSGTVVDGRDNVHVYVRLTQVVSVERHYSLNRALTHYLHPDLDSKFNDNALLRVPGTLNHKTDPPRPVFISGGHDRSVSPDRLAQFLGAAEAPQRRVETRWRRVGTSHVPSHVVRLTRMRVDEAIGRFNSRHRAAWFAIGRLIEHGLTDDEIHTLMDGFPPAVDKWSSDKWHNQIDEVLNKRRAQR